ncbi:MAG TPA: hypothetical protein VFV58_37355 [Blastocatellia bacterium]|jgi:hypothetical protein|nr:hypothetical protein [Blastocatellia bacterium]
MTNQKLKKGSGSMMRLGLYGAACVIALMLNFAIITMSANGKNAQNPQIAADLTRFRNYMEEINPGKKWRSGPTPMDSEEIRTAYGKARFYSVYSSPPMPPGAPLPELIEEYDRKMDEYHKQFISMTIRIDETENMAPLSGAEDYNQGLMRVTTDDDARICAAAILSLYSSGRVGPQIVTAKEVTVTRSENGWSCSVFRENAFRGEVVFDKDGKCVSMTKVYAGPLPS